MSLSVSQTPAGEYLRALASTAAVPGGGSAAALTGAMGCALVSMVAKLSQKRAADAAAARTLEEIVPEADRLAERLLELSQEDVDAYRAVVSTRRERGSDREALARVSVRAAEVPLEAARAAARAIELQRRLEPLAWSMTASDAEAAGLLLQAGLRAALANVAINLPELEGEARQRIEAEYRRLKDAG
jgi:methenyltetrahydrofolate cyclohydrolase